MRKEKTAAESRKPDGESGNRSFVQFVKKMAYRVRARDYRKVIAWMLFGGILAGLLYFIALLYINYDVSRAQISLVYPEIAEGKYPDGSRFTAVELISSDRLETALEKMQAQGKYPNFTIRDIADHIRISAYLEEPVSANVSSMRSAGSNYTYVANEYSIIFTQPHDYQAEGLWKKIFPDNYSEEYLNYLIEANLENLSLHCGGMEGFTQMAAVTGLEDLDYSERYGVYKTKLVAILNFLKGLNSNSGGYISDNTGKSLKDVINMYSVLFNDRLETIESFVETSGISKDLQTTRNKLAVQSENLTLKYAKYTDFVAVNDYAINNYDHTFTENIIIIATTDEKGLYQARPKTEYDIIVNQYNLYQNEAFETKDSIAQLNEKLARYFDLKQDKTENERLTKKCDVLWQNFDTDYAELSKTAAQTVADYLSYTNQQYLLFKIKPVRILSLKNLVKIGGVTVLGMMIVFILYVVCISSFNRRRSKAKKRLLESIQNAEFSERKSSGERGNRL